MYTSPIRVHTCPSHLYTVHSCYTAQFPLHMYSTFVLILLAKTIGIFPPTIY